MAKLALCFISVVLAGCGIGDQGDNVGESDTHGAETPSPRAVVQAPFSKSGGDLSIDQPGSTLHGVVLSVPPDALTAEDVLTISTNHERVDIRDGKWLGTVYVLTAGTHNEFEKPVEVTVPLPPEWVGHLVLPYNIDDAGRLHVMNRRQTDDGGKGIIVSTWKPCTFTLVGVESLL